MSESVNAFVAWVRRYPYAAVCLLLAVLFAGGPWYLHGRVRDLRRALLDRTREGEAMLSLMVGGSVQRQELAFARETVRRIEENLIVESNLADNTWYFLKLEEQTRAHLPEWHQLNSPANDRSPLYKRVPYTLRVTGTHEQVISFLQKLETGPRLVRVVAFSATRQGLTGELSLDLSVEILGKK